ncbi:ABC transporter ATP-binding protein [Liquorilactobacillus nagelii]|uniref:ABC transporter ATP-binding protein n=1 Tax=Liquorilactobacillus nagelii TaxID=82688 RepID=UPI0039EAAB12
MHFEDLQADYQGQMVFEKISARLSTGKITTLLGLNGSGKSTLMLLLASLKSANLGTIEAMGEKIFYLPQKNQVFDYLTVEELLTINQTKDLTRLNRLIELFGLKSLLQRDISLLSGGQQQRAWLVYALSQPAEILLLDEPLTYLDLKYQQRFFEALIWQQQAGRTILLSLHDIIFAARCSQNIWFLTNNKLVSGTARKMLTGKNLVDYLELSSNYAQMLLSAIRREEVYEKRSTTD